MPALTARHFPQPDLSTVVAPSGGVQRPQSHNNEGTATAPATRSRTGGVFHYLAGRPEVTSTSTDPLFSYPYPAPKCPHFGGSQSLMGCKQYARMLGLSRGYPYILYLDLSKWDAAPSPGLFHRGIFREFHRQKARRHDRLSHPDLPWFPMLLCLVAAQSSGVAHAIISARAELRRFRSAMGKFRRFSRGHFSRAGPMAT